jgi:hypothetical protein
VGLQACLKFGAESSAFEVDVAQLGGDPGDDPPECLSARDDDVLLFESSQDFRGQGLGQPGRAGFHDLGHGLRGQPCQGVRG